MTPGSKNRNGTSAKADGDSDSEKYTERERERERERENARIGMTERGNYQEQDREVIYRRQRRSWRQPERERKRRA